MLLFPEESEPESYGMFTMRPYQSDAVNSTYEAWKEIDSALVVMATGLGKTVVFSEVASRWDNHNGRVLIIAHRKELIDQAAEKYEAHDGEKPGIEMGTRSESRSGHSMYDRSKVLVTSIQTLNSGKRCKKCQGAICESCIGGLRRRMQDFDPMDFGLLIYDEAHHAVSNSGRRAIEYFRKNPNIKELYVTATPNRVDQIGMHNVVDRCVFNMGIKPAVDEGWLVPIQQSFINVQGLDFYKVDLPRGDFAQGQLAEVMGGGQETENEELIKQQEEMLHAIASPTIREANGRSVLVFAVNLAQAERLTEIFRRHDGVTSEFVHGGTPGEIRDEIFNDFKKGRTQILVNVGIATEGFDAPNCEVVAMARPTKSLSLYIQCIGRGTRTLPGVLDGLETPEERKAAIAASDKPFMTVLDFVGNSGRHKLISTADVLAGETAPEVIEIALEAAKESGESVDMLKAIREQEEKALERERERIRKQKEDEKKRARIKAEAKYRSEEVDPFGRHVVPDRHQSAYAGGASEKQVKLLVKLGVDPETALGYTRRQASAVISSYKERTGGEYVLSFGKHAGTSLKDTNSHYLDWIKDKMTGDLGDEVRRNIELMESENVPF